MRNLTVERLVEGKKQNPDFRDGRSRKLNSYTQVEEITGISKSTLIRAKREGAKGADNDG